MYLYISCLGKSSTDRYPKGSDKGIWFMVIFNLQSQFLVKKSNHFFHNRITKCGSTSMLKLMEELGKDWWRWRYLVAKYSVKGREIISNWSVVVFPTSELWRKKIRGSLDHSFVATLHQGKTALEYSSCLSLCSGWSSPDIFTLSTSVNTAVTSHTST